MQVILCHWTKLRWPLPPLHWCLWGWVGTCGRQLAEPKGWLAACKLCSPRAQSGITAVQVCIKLAARNLNLALIESQQSCCTVFTPALEPPLHYIMFMTINLLKLCYILKLALSSSLSNLYLVWCFWRLFCTMKTYILKDNTMQVGGSFTALLSIALRVTQKSWDSKSATSGNVKQQQSDTAIERKNEKAARDSGSWCLWSSCTRHRSRKWDWSRFCPQWPISLSFCTLLSMRTAVYTADSPCVNTHCNVILSSIALFLCFW